MNQQTNFKDTQKERDQAQSAEMLVSNLKLRKALNEACDIIDVMAEDLDRKVKEKNPDFLGVHPTVWLLKLQANQLRKT
jgi:hypothetical protein